MNSVFLGLIFFIILTFNHNETNTQPHLDSGSTDCVTMSSRGATGDAAISPHPRRLLRFARNDIANIRFCLYCDTVCKSGMTQPTNYQLLQYSFFVASAVALDIYSHRHTGDVGWICLYVNCQCGCVSSESLRSGSEGVDSLE